VTTLVRVALCSNLNRQAQERGDRREVNIPPSPPVAAEEVPPHEAAAPTETASPTGSSRYPQGVTPTPNESVLRDVLPESPELPAESPATPTPGAAPTPNPVTPSVLESVSPLDAPTPTAPAAPPEPANELLPEPVYKASPVPVYEAPPEAAPASEVPVAPQVNRTTPEADDVNK
jgi:hypothetical protein